ncbi:MAG: hypothetical protein IPH26_09180 [Sterolibacteriaceae bacterium]|uniref:Uncharacterized protein n=1 Tax=Candidatus Methylophosphatis roskildensis TaxID=2899263 RepID=A0A9D7E3K2_9PROT|nr:hypothetical protein [Candidatus Methylophosphatis roskildensis]MBK7237495.1 hypothetical protein [Sterolibacteriaceae bacterium]
MSEELIARKHWIVYVGPAFRLAVTAAIIWLLAQLAIANGLVDDPFLVQAFAAAMLAFTATTSLYRVLLLASVRWSATPQRVDLARGVLPWKKFRYGAPYAQLFDCWYEHTFLGWLLGYANVRIRLREGTTHEIQESYLARGRKLSDRINHGIEGALPHR